MTLEIIQTPRTPAPSCAGHAAIDAAQSAPRKSAHEEVPLGILPDVTLKWSTKKENQHFQEFSAGFQRIFQNS